MSAMLVKATKELLCRDWSDGPSLPKRDVSVTYVYPSVCLGLRERTNWVLSASY